MEHWISRNSHQWSTWLATQWHLTPYHVSIITNQSKQSLNEFEQQGFSQACLTYTPLMRYWCLHCLHSFFFFYNGKRKKNQFLHRCLPLQSSEKYSLFSLTSIEPYPLRTDIKSLISLTDIQDKFNNSFLIILSSYVHLYISATS